jgi:hypothetical protein
MMHRDSEMHRRRMPRNFAVLAVLVGFIALVFGLTVVKVQTGGLGQSFDHVLRPEAIPGQTPQEVTQ